MRLTSSPVFMVTLVLAACGAEASHQAATPTLRSYQASVSEERFATPTEEELPGLEVDTVVDVVSDHQGAVSGCHVVGNGATGSERDAGAVTLSWWINPDGSVRDVQVANSSFDNAPFHECLVAVIKGLQFPSAPGATEIGEWRFRFRAPLGDTAAN